MRTPKRVALLPLSDRPPRRMRAEDLTGRRFNSLVALECVGRNKWGNLVWRFGCDCGSSINTESKSVKAGLTKTCGCQGIAEKMIGRVFSKLTVVSFAGTSRTARGNTWVCLCACGGIRTVLTSCLTRGVVRNCTDWRHRERDIAGETFGLLTAIERIDSKTWKFKCACGNVCTASRPAITSSPTRRSCGCLGAVSGADVPRATLTWEQVEEIRAALQTPYWGIGADLARRYGVTDSIICHIRHGKTYVEKAAPLRSAK
jgi:hypothetical protein